jgi:hypothetical protein
MPDGRKKFTSAESTQGVLPGPSPQPLMANGAAEILAGGEGRQEVRIALIGM